VNVVLDTDRVSLIHGETLATLRSFPDKSFDVSLFDPPYSEHVHEKFGKERRNDGVKVRDALTFPPMTPELIAIIMREVVRVTKTWVLVTTDFYNTHLWGEAARDSGGAWVRTGQWVKTNPKPQMTSDRPGCGAEDILIAHAMPDTLEGRRGWDWNGGGHAATWRGRRDQGFALDGAEPHPNQKPAWLMQSLLGMFCPPNALVLDCYFGSGTTAIAALAQERLEGESALETACPKCSKKILEQYQPPLPVGVRVVGVEGDPKYVDLSIARIRAASPSLLAA
jgi:site-specific DNA-methyltransferase (adenine-specific)